MGKRLDVIKLNLDLRDVSNVKKKVIWLEIVLKLVKKTMEEEVKVGVEKVALTVVNKDTFLDNAPILRSKEIEVEILEITEKDKPQTKVLLQERIMPEEVFQDQLLNPRENTTKEEVQALHHQLAKSEGLEEDTIVAVVVIEVKGDTIDVREAEVPR